MRKSRFTEGQIIATQAEQERGLATAEVCRNHGISQSTGKSSQRTELAR